MLRNFKSFCCSIWVWVIRRYLYLLNVIHSYKFTNSPDTNCGPLSETISPGNPYAANKFLSVSIVLHEQMKLLCLTMDSLLATLEWASMYARKYWPWSFPAISTWMRSHGFECSGVQGADFKEIHKLHNFLIYARPPKASSHGCYSDDSQVLFMKCF